MLQHVAADFCWFPQMGFLRGSAMQHICNKPASDLVGGKALLGYLGRRLEQGFVVPSQLAKWTDRRDLGLQPEAARAPGGFRYEDQSLPWA